MSTDINLLTHVDETASKQAGRKRLVGFLAAVILIAVGAITVGIFMMIQALNVNGIKKEQANVIEKLDELADQQVDLFIANKRVENIEKILKTRKNLSVAVDALINRMPDDFLLTEMKVDVESVTISGRSDSLAIIGEAIGNMTEMAKNKEIIKSLTLKSLVLEENRNEKYYSVSLKSDM